MKISKLFHWLYASLMFLPLLIAPLFAIYSHRHEINDYSVQVQETKAVDFNQIIVNPNFVNADNVYKYGSFTSYTITDNNCVNVIINDTGSYAYEYSIFRDFSATLTGHQYYIRFKANLGDFTGFVCDSFGGYAQYNLVDGYYTLLYTETSSNTHLYICPLGTYSIGNSYSISDTCIFDLTQMFGSGNEPTIQQFNSWYGQDFYPYTLSHRELLKTGNYIIYDDTDIGSQFLYDLYNTTDKYLNFDSVFNLYQVNDWINLNVFNGSVPLVWYIIWHYLDYWLLLSIFWLCFDILMYVPQLCHRWLDKASLE